MFGRRRTPPQDLRVHIASTDSSPRASVALDDPSSENITMSENASSKPLSVAIPKSFDAIGPYCMRRPNLSEILANESLPPFTLSAFMAYLSQNHCLETLEFTMDASRYTKHFTKMTGRVPGGVLLPHSEEATYLKMLWARLMEAYIIPNGAREVNVPAEIRNELLSLAETHDGPPIPSSLDKAVQHIYTLMEESVLLPFLNSCYPQTAVSEYSASAENLQTTQSNHAQSAHPISSHSYEERGFYRNSQRKSSPQGQKSSSYFAPSSPSLSSNRISAPSTFSSLARGLSVRQHRSSGIAGIPDSKSPTPLSNDSEMTDDLMSTTSTTTSHSLSHFESNGSVGLHTPPTTPPMSDCQPYIGEASPLSASISSPTESQHAREGAWKRGMTKLGLRRSNRHRSQGSPDVVMEE